MGFKIFAVFCAVSTSLLAADVKVLEQIVAKVNGDIVTQGEIDRARQQLVAQMEADKVPRRTGADPEGEGKGTSSRIRSMGFF